MNPSTRRAVLQATGLTGLTLTAGCLTGSNAFTDATDSSDDACEVGRTLHTTDLDLPTTAAWPTYQCDAGNTGYTPDATGPTSETVDVAWRYSACAATESGVAVRDGRVYTDGLVVDGRTGARNGGEWHGHMSTPTVTEELVYVGVHNLEAREPQSGQLQWTFETDGRAGGISAPKVASGRLYVPGNIDDPTLYAIHAADGSETWRYTTADRVEAPVAVGDGIIFAVDESRTRYALDSETGEEVWTRPVERAKSWRYPVVAEGTLYWGSRNGVTACSTTDGATSWEQSTVPGGAVAVADGSLYVAGEESLAALEPSTGQLQWQTTTPIVDPGPPAVTDDLVCLAQTTGGSGSVIGLNSTTGEQQWQIDTRGVQFGDYGSRGVPQSLAIVDESVFVATAAGDVYAIG